MCIRDRTLAGPSAVHIGLTPVDARYGSLLVAQARGPPVRYTICERSAHGWCCAAVGILEELEILLVAHLRAVDAEARCAEGYPDWLGSRTSRAIVLVARVATRSDVGLVVRVGVGRAFFERIRVTCVALIWRGEVGNLDLSLIHI